MPIRRRPKTGLPVGHLTGGWQAEYGKGDAPRALLKRTEAAIDWDWGATPPAPELDADQFWAHWSGVLVPPESDDYVFHLDAADGARFFLNGLLLADCYNSGPDKLDTPPLHLEKGKRYLATLDFTSHFGQSRCALLWSSKTLRAEPVRALGTGDADGELSPWDSG